MKKLKKEYAAVDPVVEPLEEEEDDDPSLPIGLLAAIGELFSLPLTFISFIKLLLMHYTIRFRYKIRKETNL